MRDRPLPQPFSLYPVRFFIYSVLMLCLPAVSAGRIAGAREIRIGPERAHLQPVTYAEIEISGDVPERLPELYVLRPAVDTLHDIVRRIHEASDDHEVEGLLVRLGRFGGGWGRGQEIRRALHHAAQQRKEVVVYLEHGGNLPYYIASVADRIIVPPATALMLTGLRAEVMFMRRLFDTIGITPDFVQIGSYKGASDAFTHETASEPFREAINSLLDAAYDQFVTAIAAGRRLNREAVVDLIDTGPFSAQHALEAGLVDGVSTYRQLQDDLERRERAPLNLLSDYGRDDATSIPLGEGTQRLLKMLLGLHTEPDVRARIPDGPVIAVVYAVGPVVLQRPDTAMIDDSVIDARQIIGLLDKLEKEPNVKAIVLRIESPGGDAQASDMLWHAIRRTDRIKPVVASMADVAGSGGYYVASACRRIFASEGSLTGSIGVMGGKFVLRDLLDKIGIHIDVFQRGEHAGLFSPVDTFSDRQRERFTELLRTTYDTFLHRVAQARNIPLQDLQTVADGRAYTGSQALHHRLVDEIGGLRDAVQYAVQAAGLDDDDDVQVLSLPRSQSVLDAIFWGRDIGVRAPPGHRVPGDMRSWLPASAADGLLYLHAVSLLRDFQPAALLPVMIRIR